MVQLRVGPIVRAIDTTSVVIWVELSQACVVTLKAAPYSDQGSEARSRSVHTVMVGGRYYAAPQLHGLQSGTWYSYDIYTGDEHESILTDQTSPLLQCFRTLDHREAGGGREQGTLRLMYGSCCRLDRPEDDTLNALGGWLTHHFEQRELAWPHLLLLIGDQIYADNPPSPLIQLHPEIQRKKGITIFTDFADLYKYVWTREKGVRQVLATLPTYMMFDDHEVYNNWNLWLSVL